jgi:hypothetical protein
MERIVWRLPVPSFSKILRSVVTIEMPFRQDILVERVEMACMVFPCPL